MYFGIETESFQLRNSARVSDAINIESGYTAWSACLSTGWVPLPRNGCTVNHPRSLNLQEKTRVFGWIVTTTHSSPEKTISCTPESTEASVSWKECKASSFKHGRNEYKSPNLSWWKWRASSCAIPQQKKINSVTQSFLHAFTLQSDGRI